MGQLWNILMLLYLVRTHECFWHQVCDISPVDGCTCFLLNNLPQIVCRGLGLTEIPNISGVNEIGFLDLSENNFTEFDRLPFEDIVVYDLVLSNNKRPLSPVLSGGAHSVSMVRLSLSGDGLDQLPLLESFSQLHHLDLSNNNIRALVTSHGSAFAGLLRLIHLDISNNLIAHPVNGPEFTNLPALKELELSIDGDLVYILGEENIMVLANQLDHLDLSNSRIDAGSFDSLKLFTSLKILSLGGCNLNNNLLNNADYHLTADASLTHLDISNNQFDRFPHRVLRGCSSLEYLSLSENLISFYDDQSAEPLSNVVYLDLSHNMLVTFGGFHHTFPNLIELNLNHNFIKIVDLHHSINLRHLDVLDISYNSIHTITPSHPPNVIKPDILRVFIENNPLECCSNMWIADIFVKQIVEGDGHFTWYDVYNAECEYDILGTIFKFNLIDVSYDKDDWVTVCST